MIYQSSKNKAVVCLLTALLLFSGYSAAFGEAHLNAPKDNGLSLAFIPLGLNALKDISYRAKITKIELETDFKLPSNTGSFLTIEQYSKEITLDCVWVSAQPYFETFHTGDVDPYEVNPKELEHSILPLASFGKDPIVYLLDDTTHITSNFGNRRYRWHYGTDLKLQRGDAVRSLFDGVVRMARYDRRGYGYYVLVRHRNGIETLYGHLSKIQVKVGDEVAQGQEIGLGGNTGRSTGTHLHLEMRYKGLAFNPEDVIDFETMEFKESILSMGQDRFAYLIELRSQKYHRVRWGNTLGQIAMNYGSSITKICRLNNISRSTILRVGQRLRVR